MQEEQRSLSSMDTVSVLQLIRDPSVRWQLVTVIVVNAGMQLSGIDAVCVFNSGTAYDNYHKMAMTLFEIIKWNTWFLFLDLVLHQYHL